MCNDRTVTEQGQWGRVLADLDDESIKLAAYDETMVPLFGDLEDLRILDYGSGPGVLAAALQNAGADVAVHDISSEMCDAAATKIGTENVFYSADEIPAQSFDVVICNLVLCIVEEPIVRDILANLRRAVRQGGRIFIGFCNPEIFRVEESRLDFREPTGEDYTCNHSFWKIKKEGGYRIIELHRPIEWYEAAFEAAGLALTTTHFTTEYILGGEAIRDFVIFKLTK